MTECSCIASSRADWVLGVARLISSASTICEKIGPGLKLEDPAAVGQLHDDVGADDVGRHQVGGELDPVEVERDGVGQGAHQQRLAQARHAFQQRMPADEQAGQERRGRSRRGRRSPWRSRPSPSRRPSEIPRRGLPSIRRQRRPSTAVLSLKLVADSRLWICRVGRGTQTGGRGSRADGCSSRFLVFFSFFPDPLLGLEQAVGVALLSRSRGDRRRGWGSAVFWAARAAVCDRSPPSSSGSPIGPVGGRIRERQRGGLGPGGGAGAVELLADLGLAAPELVHVFAGGRGLLPAELLPFVGDRLLDPVDVERDPADGDVAQEQARRQPEQGRPERGERAGIDQPGVAPEVVDSCTCAAGRSGRPASSSRARPCRRSGCASVSSVVGLDRSSRYSSE